MSWNRVLAVASLVSLFGALGVLGACGDNIKVEGESARGEIWVDAPLDAATSEAGAEVTVELVLSRAPTARVMVPVSSDTPGEGEPAMAQVVFEAGETGPKQLVVRGVDDADIDGAKDYQLIFGAAESDDARFRGAQARKVPLRNLDNDVPLGTVTVARIYGGSGRVTSAPAGIDCPGKCSADFAIGSTVVLTATAAAGSKLGGWIRGTAVSFAPTLMVSAVAGETSVSAGFVRDELTWLGALDGLGAERLDAIAMNAGRVYAGGDFVGATTIAGQALVNGGGRDAILVAANATTGAVSWIRTFGGSGDAHVTSIAALDNGDILAGGWFTGQIVLDGTTYTASGTGSFLMRLIGSDGTFLWTAHITQGPNQGIADVGGLDDGGVVACGAGTAPIGWYDGAGGYLASTSPGGLSTCDALDKRLGGWFVAGWGGGSAQAAFSSVSDDHSATVAKIISTPSGPVIVDDLETLSGGGAVVAVVEPVAGGHRPVLVKVDSTGFIMVRKELGQSAFLRSVSMFDEGGGVVVMARRTGTSQLVVERRAVATLDVASTFSLEQPTVTTFAIAGNGARRFLVGASVATSPLPGRDVTLLGALGSFWGELKL